MPNNLTKYYAMRENMKRIFIFIFTFLLIGCATYKECKEVKTFFIKEKTCHSEYLMLNVTGGNPYCADERDIQNIKEHCGWFF